MKIISNDEIKVVLGITGSDQDDLIETWNSIATEMLLNLLDVSDLTTHTITDEEVYIQNSERLIVSEFPIDTSQTITIKDALKNEITGYTFENVSNRSRRALRVLDDSGMPSSLGYSKLFVSYTAGYTTQDTIEVLDWVNLIGKTLKVYVAGTLTTWTFVGVAPGTNEIRVDGTNEITAGYIVDALGGSSSGAIATLPLGTKVELGTSSNSELTITNATMPSTLKNAIAMIVGGGIAEKTKQGDVVELKIDDKTIKFGGSTKSEAILNGQNFATSMEYWIPFFKKSNLKFI